MHEIIELYTGKPVSASVFLSTCVIPSVAVNASVAVHTDRGSVDAASTELKVGSSVLGRVSYNFEEHVQQSSGQRYVYKATAVGSENRYALKVAKKHNSSSLQKEANNYFSLNPTLCPHVALLTDIAGHPTLRNTPILVTNWGNVFSDYVTVVQKLPPRYARGLLLDHLINLLRGLRSLHEPEVCGDEIARDVIVHQNVKPGNVVGYKDAHNEYV
jgi:hypothetical protein